MTNPLLERICHYVPSSGKLSNQMVFIMFKSSNL